MCSKSYYKYLEYVQCMIMQETFIACVTVLAAQTCNTEVDPSNGTLNQCCFHVGPVSATDDDTKMSFLR